MQRDRFLERLRAWLPTALTAALAGVAGVVGSYAAAGFTPGFVVAPVAGFMTRNMPGAVITFAIQNLGDLGQKLNLVSAIGASTALLAVGALVGLAVGRRFGASDTVDARAGAITSGVLAGALPWGATTALTGDPALALGAGIPAGLVVGLEEVLRTAAGTDSPVESVVSPGRRRVVEGAVAVLAVGGVGVVLGGGSDSDAGRSLDEEDSTPTPADSSEQADEGTDEPTETPTQRERLLSAAEDKSLDVDGVEPLLSEKFYTVDVNSVKPDVSADDWTLSVTGAVEQEVTVDYDDIRSMESEDRFVTLRCVGESLNGRKLDNALWTGVPIMQFVEEAVPQSGCECVMLRAADDYFEEFPLAAMNDGFLAYGMNGEALPREHGYPARALIPGHWGEINVKWITEIEILDETADGYWERRGWHGTGPVNTVAKLETVNKRSDTIQVGGRAYAGTRGVQTVEVSTDGGSTWSEATLSDPLPETVPTPPENADPGETPFGEDVLRQWVYEYDKPASAHEVVVRAIDGTGAVQPKEESDAFPSGASGWVSQNVNP